MRLRAWVLAVACVASLPACVPRPVRAPIADLPQGQRAEAEQAQVAREAALAGQARWTLQGRAAISRGDKGGSGRIDWRQEGQSYRLALSAPVTRQSWRLVGDASHARIEGLDGGPREGADASQLLLEATGLEIPVAALASWARGARADEDRFGPARLHFDAERRLARLVQGGWTIDYLAWQGGQGAIPSLPTRLDAARGDARVRLIVDAWNTEGGGPPAQAAADGAEDR
ncbi:lipoprotein insertase outer membrane protein LolB [Luteimonas vadosa]|uniref:Outer-membrane lipoprotein LolB n=1 Tax=Luteimonas vadosa TaxID=1165507 RepID=A0ABP9E6M5_9GAMM